MTEKQKTRPVSSTRMMNTRLVKQNDLNAIGTLYGGLLPVWLDEYAAVTARLHSGYTCVTASFDAIEFKTPIYISDVVFIRTTINRVWESSCEVGVRITALSEREPRERYITSTYVTFVALGKDRKPTSMRKVTPHTKDENRRYAEADERRKRRLELHRKKKTS